ncbi:DUF1631 family protein [Extensimonas perlucida]|uniref:DUF1631 family protein n=1 Tax=Extensimonas perlucida TaxID=2590786 RepID=UPI0011A3E238|nr:DUF1631 family protein [Extensimonas perlucida]
MPAPPSSAAQRRHLSQQVRERFVQGLCAQLAPLDKVLLDHLSERMAAPGTLREMQTRRDAWMLYQQHHARWIACVEQALRQAASAAADVAKPATARAAQPRSFELLGDDVMENKITATRMAAAVLEQVGLQFDAVRQRTQTLEGDAPPAQDILRPESVCLVFVEQWVQAELPREQFQAVQEPLQRALANLLQKQYQAINAWYVEQGITPQSDLRVRRTPAPSPAGPGAAAGQPAAPARMPGAPPGAGAPGAFPSGALAHGSFPAGGLPAGHAAASAYAAAAGLPPAAGATPWVRARARAQSIMGHLRRLLQPVIGLDLAQAPPASAALAQALAEARTEAASFYVSISPTFPGYGPAAVAQSAEAARRQTEELKQKAGTAGERAIIELVALMFQSILAEERIPPSVRVWFARLQLPVLRVALAEPAFLSDLKHPARQLIDRMGGCVMGFDASTLSGSALEAEIRRVVQVVEQYPETGSRVFQLVLTEFERFLAKFLTEKEGIARIVSVAQQVEQKDTLAVQYTIELRTMLQDVPVRDEVRDFLLKTWAEVLALSAVRAGAQHADTLAYKRAAADLIWAASAKPQRSERAQVIKALPGLLQNLRQGLALVGITGAKQDAQIKALTDTLADAFLSKTESIAQAHIDALAERLARLEDIVTDAAFADMPLNADNVEMLLGIDASALDVLADNGAPVQDAVLAWVQALPLGAWFTLEHNAARVSVQYVWQSARRQLHLFASASGHSYLIQLRRLAAYAQAGLLVGLDEEGLSLRATRDAITKLDANPERLGGAGSA